MIEGVLHILVLPNHLHPLTCGVDKVELKMGCDLRIGILESWKLDNWVKVPSPYRLSILVIQLNSGS